MSLPNSQDEDTIYLVTKNAMKLAEWEDFLFKHPKIVVKQMELDEYQGDAEYVAKQKCLSAARILKRSVIIEDSGLCFTALNGLPGPYIKWFLKSIGTDNLPRLLTDWSDKSANAYCFIAYNDGKTDKVHLFEGRIQGKIVPPVGDRRFGWDPCFMPNGYDKTFAQMTIEEKKLISHRAIALNKLSEFLRQDCRYC